MRAGWPASIGPIVRREVTAQALRELMRELSRTAPPGEQFQVFIVGGGTAVLSGWRTSTIDVDLYAEREEVFRDVQGIKERLRLNIEFVRPEHFVPALEDSAARHIFIDRVGSVEFYHYDPYAQLLSKLVRGFRKDLLDAEQFVRSGMVDPRRFLELVRRIPDSAYARYPNLSSRSVRAVIEDFLATVEQ